MKILVATDAWFPQVNGVLATYMRLAEELPALGCELTFLTPEHFRTRAMPGYPEIRLAIPDRKRAAAVLDAAAPDHVHIATEGPVGWMARAYCRRRSNVFTTSFHTRFPEYAAQHFGMPKAIVYAGLKAFHGASAGLMVAAPSLQRDLAQRGFRNIRAWTRGVDTDLFHPRSDRLFGQDGPVFLYVGRVSREKNIEAFLSAELPGIKAVVGDGPHLRTLTERFPGVHFMGRRTGNDLACLFASADVFVFPSRTDSFGLVILEALASGLPVAAYPVTGPLDILEDGVSGAIDTDIARAALRALSLSRTDARRRALDFTWRRTAEMFLDNIRYSRAAASAPLAAPSATPSRSAAEKACTPTAIRRL
jgi:glycosyltransferase involved in cell wall biosynthesis